MAKKNIPTFDELKNPDYEYHYSRAERLSMQRRPVEECDQPPVKGLRRFFGKNRTFSRYFIFYLAFGGLAWYYFYLTKGALSAAEKQSWVLPGNISAEVRLIQTDTRHGLNVALQNKKSSTALSYTGSFTLSLDGVIFATNLALTLEKGEVAAFFADVSTNITNIAEMSLLEAMQ